MQQLYKSGTCIALLFHFLLSLRPLQTASNEKRKLFLKTQYVKKPFCLVFLLVNFRSTHIEMFCKNGVFENFTKFTGKHLRRCLFSNKVAGLIPATLLKMRF